MPWRGRPTVRTKSSPVLIQACRTYPRIHCWRSFRTIRIGLLYEPLLTALPRPWLRRRIFWRRFDLLSKFFDLLLSVQWIVRRFYWQPVWVTLFYCSGSSSYPCCWRAICLRISCSNVFKRGTLIVCMHALYAHGVFVRRFRILLKAFF